jgi:hypothetical protein
MITNLIASVTFMLVTNTVSVDTEFERYEPDSCPEIGRGYYCAVYHRKGVNPTAKTVTTEINLLSIATFKFQGESYTVTNSKAIDRTVKRFVKQSEWVESQTNGGWKGTPYDGGYHWEWTTNAYVITNFMMGTLVVSNLDLDRPGIRGIRPGAYAITNLPTGFGWLDAITNNYNPDNYKSGFRGYKAGKYGPGVDGR